MQDFSQKLQSAMADVAAMNDTHGIEIRKGSGKRYTTVAMRVEAFRRSFGTDGAIITEIVTADDYAVLIKAQVRVLLSDGWQVVATGHCEEVRTSSAVNRTSALENCETGAIGRALANLGLHGGEMASVNEIEKAQAKEADTKGAENEEIQKCIATLKAAKTLDALATAYAGFTKEQRAATEALKDVLKGKLNEPQSGSKSVKES